MGELGTLQCTNTSSRLPAPMHVAGKNTNESYTDHTVSPFALGAETRRMG